MTFNNRIIRKKWKLSSIDPRVTEGYDYSIHEVYYDKKNGKIIGWTEDAMVFEGESVKELKDNIKFRQEAFKAPVLEIITFRGKEKLIEVK